MSTENKLKRSVKDPLERKNEIIDAAEILFVEKGYEKTSIRNIIKKVGVAHGLFYYYFKSKDDVLEAIVERYWGMVEESMDNIINDQNLSAIQKMEKTFFITMEYKKNNIKRYSYIIESNDPMLMNKVLDKGIKIMVPKYAKIVEQGIEEKIFDTPDPQKAMEFFFVGNIYLRNLRDILERPEEYKETLEFIYDILERTLGAERGTFSKSLNRSKIALDEILTKLNSNRL